MGVPSLIQRFIMRLTREILRQPERIFGIDKDADADTMKVPAQQIAPVSIIGRLLTHHAILLYYVKQIIKRVSSINIERWHTIMDDHSQYKGPEYPTQAHGNIPAFNSYEEEANFWDAHDITDFTHETKEVKVSEISSHQQ